MEHALSEVKSAEEWLRRLERQIVERGGAQQDNYSALAVWCAESEATAEEGAPPPASTQTSISL